VVVKTATECLITLEGVSKVYQQPNGQKISILEPINLELRSGEIVALLGPSGSGKSTLMRIIAGLIPPSNGQVLYHNRPLVGLNPGVAIVFQNFALYPWLTVLENVELGLKAKGELPEPRLQKALRMIDIIGLDGFENAYPKELSGGMRQRVGFARALAVEPELLCMDEPFSALDVLTAENLRFELLDLWLEKKIPTKAVLIVTHGIEEAVILADRIVVLGRLPISSSSENFNSLIRHFAVDSGFIIFTRSCFSISYFISRSKNRRRTRIDYLNIYWDDLEYDL
jgi:NitT/TauT family transport system ATP-binding protein